MILKIKIIILLLLIIPMSAHAGRTRELIFPRGTLIMLGLPYINKDYYSLEIGFITDKRITKWDYSYNVYVTGALFEDWVDRNDDYRAGGLGFKAGGYFPVQPWVPFFFTFTGGFAKTVLHTNPIMGKDDQNIGKKDMFLLEAGFLYRYDQYLIKYVYQQSNVKYFKRHLILTLGVSY